MRAEDRALAVQTVSERVCQQFLALPPADDESSRDSLEAILEDTIWHERKRLESGRADGDPDADRSFWRSISGRLHKASHAEREQLLSQVVRRFETEIAGHFDPRVYDVATRLIPVGLGLLLNAASPKLLFRHFPRLPDVTDRVFLRGEVSALRTLRDRGTVILTPTHISNLDSVVVGWSLHALGLPPFVYGAGLNLFRNPMMAYFMRNLGAYRVDRKKTAPLYRQVLKEHSTVTLEQGYDNLFFPGGTRARSGMVEKKLKLGLLGCGLRAYINNLMSGREKPAIYIVPCSIAYPLVLEAEHLIEDHLQEKGKSRYIIEDDEFSQPRRVLQFVSNVLSMDARITVRFGRAMDPFGNPVDEEGRSLDPKGRPIDPSRYVMIDGQPAHLQQRDAEYTRELGKALIKSLHRENVITSTQLLAFCVFRLLSRGHPDLDLYRLLRQIDGSGAESNGNASALSVREVEQALELLLDHVRRLASQGDIHLDDELDSASATRVLQHALRRFGSYHRRAVIMRRADSLSVGDPELLLYYSNRLTGYDLEQTIGHQPSEAPS